MKQTVLVTGGAGYTGAVLVQVLLTAGYSVRVVDLMMYGEDTLPEHPSLQVYRMDIRETGFAEVLDGVDAVYHLAGVSNDPGEGLDPQIGLEVNYHAVKRLVSACKERGVRRFIYPSSCSIYGATKTDLVTEETEASPLTDYGRCKALCEEVILREHSETFCCTILRPATVCGFSPRQRFDLLVNGFTNQAYVRRSIEVRGPERIRPGVHILDLVDLYRLLLELPASVVGGEVFNVAFENRTVLEMARLVSQIVGDDVELQVDRGDDRRSYRVDSTKLHERTGFVPGRTTVDAVSSLLAVFKSGQFRDTFADGRYHNKLRQSQHLRLFGS